MQSMTEHSGTSHWWRWHKDYADPDSALSRRLATVVVRIKEAVDACQMGPITLISACAGQGRDVIVALDGHKRREDVRGLLVELDPANAAAASAGVRAAGLSDITVLETDAGRTDSYIGYVPADVVLLCGIFGNIPAADIRRTIEHASSLSAAGATVIWTRHRQPPDLTYAIRNWWTESGFQEIAFDSPPDESFAVGVQRYAGTPAAFQPGVRLFTFT
jgi:hypothetical protein